MNHFANLHKLGIYNRVHIISMAINDFRSVISSIKEIQPHEIYNLAGQSSVALSFEQPVETLESITVGALNLLESIRFLDDSYSRYSPYRLSKRHLGSSAESVGEIRFW